MMRARRTIHSLTQGVVLGAFVALIGPLLSPEPRTGTAWAQEAAPNQPAATPQPSRHGNRYTRRGTPPTRATEDQSGGVPSGSSSTGPLSIALAACDKQFGRPEGLTLPGAKAEIKIDRCYPGRDHFVCTINALSTEAKSVLDDFTKIVDANYPSIDNVESICSIASDVLSADLTKSSTFVPRFRDLKNGYESLVGCASKVGQELKIVNLSDMAQAADILKSMNAALQDDMKDVAASRQQVFDLAQKMDAAQKAMAVIQKIHLTMCVASGQEKQATDSGQ